MATTSKRQFLIELIQKHLNIAPENTLEKVLELLEDEEDIRDARAEIDPRLLKEVGDLVSHE